ncbi:glycosyltransferase family 2 protein [Vibrio parahaemolyticus]|uniref:glycosyltransferase family 2 protein n=1 Tax=Vibrio parahaemolyticus TaxID=670 RepID=UPI001037494C|nr:glycosyltransferase family 2 protein [Vibrio parahaemolyticus]EJG1064225.1 glycosyltransferase family 2 protein [Vibrio parahaemolyticus O1]EGR2045974.1 glycosyltransferase family 2 protein [Vibrio parahaemolyticus]MDA0388948.1 glycosyltransferase family 2 protein [Vibrio parahaemolyticus]MDA0392862.1 glycosyltransferase family 2 protein [Vibrio parahaemolyticus]MDA0398050.1 glycosyltransferase family 2 protein [Vibrio parahaemolyticus]
MNSKEPLISVIVPVYNVEKYIIKCLNSLVNQTYSNFEVIVVDDESPDDSIKIAKAAFSEDSRFIFVSKSNGGLSCARNFGVKYSKGEYISFLDSDDYFDETFLEVMINTLMDNNADISVCAMSLVDECYDELEVRGPRENEVITGFEAFRNNLLMHTIASGAQNKLYKREHIINYPYPLGLYYEDRATTYKMFLDSSKVCLINKPLFYYLQREGSIMKGLSEKSVTDRFIVHDSIVSELEKRSLLKDNLNYLNVCYILNVIVAGSHQIAIYSKNYKKDISNLFGRIDFNVLTISSLSLMYKYHKKKFFALIVLLVSKRLFKTFCQNGKRK